MKTLYFPALTYRLSCSAVSAYVEDKASRSVLPEDNNSADAGPTDTDFGASNLVPPVSTFETNAEAVDAGSEGIELRSPLLSGTDQISSVSALATARHIEPQTRKSIFLSPNQISSAVAATERTRLFCSFAFAILVVLSYLGFPILGNKFLKSILGFRPLFLVLLTNVTVVVAELLKKQRSSGTTDRRENRAPPTDGNDLAGQLGKTLEIGLLMQKVADAVFMDCAVYAVIVVCGLSFAQKFR